MILFKPNGSLDIDTDPVDLPDDGLQRCKNLRADERGVLNLRDGGYKLNTTAIEGTPDFVIEQSGNRYVFSGYRIYRNEVALTLGLQCVAPSFSPAAGAYANAQTVTITTTTTGAKIYYTTDGTDPTAGSIEYVAAIQVPLFTTVKAIAIKTGYEDSDITEGYYTSSAAAQITTEGTTFGYGTDSDTFLTETDNDNIYTEGA